jgi:hypothetical protein
VPQTRIPVDRYAPYGVACQLARDWDSLACRAKVIFRKPSVVVAQDVLQEGPGSGETASRLLGAAVARAESSPSCAREARGTSVPPKRACVRIRCGATAEWFWSSIDGEIFHDAYLARSARQRDLPESQDLRRLSRR